MKKYILVLLIFSSACTAFHHGSISETSYIDAQTAIVDFAHGYAKTIRFWGFGGNNRDALIADAKKNLLLVNPLENGQRFGNFIVDFKEAFYFPGIHKTTVTVTAEVIDKNSSNYLEALRKNIQPKNSEYKLGQIVFFYDKTSSEYREAKILEFNKKIVIIGFTDNKNRYRTKSVQQFKIRSKNPFSK